MRQSQNLSPEEARFQCCFALLAPCSDCADGISSATFIVSFAFCARQLEAVRKISQLTLELRMLRVLRPPLMAVQNSDLRTKDDNYRIREEQLLLESQLKECPSHH